MAPTGYSGTPLLQKLGIKPGMKLLLIDEPKDYITLLQTNISQQLVKQDDAPDLVHLFVKNKSDFLQVMQKLKQVYQKNTSLIIWVSWYKKSSKITTDITEDDIRNHALKSGLIDVKVCAVSEVWSGLKLVVPLAKR